MILVSGHSMPSRGRDGHDDPGRDRADVVPGTRQRTTAAAAVIEVAERVAPSSHIKSLRLTVAEDNVGAQRLYTRTGFSVVDGSATYDRGQRALRVVRPLKGA